MPRRFFLIPLIGLLGGMAWGCGRDKLSQIEVEHRAVDRIVGLLRFYEIDFPNSRPANLAKVFSDLERSYPYGLDKQFRSFGKHAGFKHSLYEKYVFLTRGVSNRAFRGEIVLLNAQPFPDRNRRLGRMVVAKAGEGYESFRVSWLEEDQIQKVFAQIGVNIPKPVPMPPPPPPPPSDNPFPPTIWDKTAGYFDTAAALLGLGAERGGQLQWFTFLCLATVFAFCGRTPPGL